MERVKAEDYLCNFVMVVLVKFFASTFGGPIFHTGPSQLFEQLHTNLVPRQEASYKYYVTTT